MERLDGEEAEAHTVDRPPVTSHEIAESLADLRSLFGDAEPATQHRIAEALFDRVEALGPSEIWLHPSVEAEARGWAAAMGGEFRVESTYGRGERDSPATNDLPIRMRLAEPPTSHELVRSA
jgi:hypothetical protein